MLNIYKLQKNNQTLKLLDCPFYRTLICILFSFQRPFLREKKNHPSLHLAFQQRIFSILYISWVLHYFQKTCLPVLLITTTKKGYCSKLLKDQFCFYLYHKLKNLSSIFFQSLKSIPNFLKFVKYFFFFCTFYLYIFKRAFCNSDLQWAYLYHTFKNLSSEKFCLAKFVYSLRLTVYCLL